MEEKRPTRCRDPRKGSRCFLILLVCVLAAEGCSSTPKRRPIRTVSPPSIEQPSVAPADAPQAVQASYSAAASGKTTPNEPESLLPPAEAVPPSAPLAEPNAPAPEQLPIDLPATLRLAGANNLQIALAAERVLQARARLEGANALWFPSLVGGVGYNMHQGQIQDTAGHLLDVRRSSLFVGGGPNLGSNPLNGANNGPSRLALGLPLADAIFAPLAQRQLVRAAAAAQTATFNDALLAVSTTYLELVRAQGQVAIAQEAVKNAGELVRLVAARVRAGTAPPADELRAMAEQSNRRRQVFQAEESVRDTSAELVRLLHLPASTNLLPAETQPVAIDLVDVRWPLPVLIANGIQARPELAANQSIVRATVERLRQEQWRPVIPNIALGFGAGGFGGGRGNFFGDFAGRNDFDALAVWELQNLGFGNDALRRERRSELYQSRITVDQIRDNIAAEVTRAYYQVQLRGGQIAASTSELQAAAEALPLNFKGILGGQLRAIEAQQAIQALATAQDQYLASVIAYDQAQFQLVRAMGNAPRLP